MMKDSLTQAQKQARSTVKEARKQARRRLFQARLAAARVRTGSRVKASGLSAKAVGAAGAAGLAAGYVLRGRTRRAPEYRTGQVNGNTEPVKGETRPPEAVGVSR